MVADILFTTTMRLVAGSVSMVADNIILFTTMRLVAGSVSMVADILFTTMRLKKLHVNNNNVMLLQLLQLSLRW